MPILKHCQQADSGTPRGAVDQGYLGLLFVRFQPRNQHFPLFPEPLKLTVKEISVDDKQRRIHRRHKEESGQGKSHQEQSRQEREKDARRQANISMSFLGGSQPVSGFLLRSGRLFERHVEHSIGGGMGREPPANDIGRRSLPGWIALIEAQFDRPVSGLDPQAGKTAATVLPACDDDAIDILA